MHIHALTGLHRASDACDIENFAEYSEIVKLIKEKKPKSVTVTINQKDIEQALKKVFYLILLHTATHITHKRTSIERSDEDDEDEDKSGDEDVRCPFELDIVDLKMSRIHPPYHQWTWN